jgi:hypothetical protein
MLLTKMWSLRNELDPGASVPADRTEPLFDAAIVDLIFLCFPSSLLNIVVDPLPVSVPFVRVYLCFPASSVDQTCLFV